MSRVKDMTQGKISSIILAFYFPLFVTNMLQQLYNFVDATIVGKGLGSYSLAAVGNMGSITFLIIGFSIGLANGFSVLIAQSFGAGDHALGCGVHQLYSTVSADLRCDDLDRRSAVCCEKYAAGHGETIYTYAFRYT